MKLYSARERQEVERKREREKKAVGCIYIYIYMYVRDKKAEENGERRAERIKVENEGCELKCELCNLPSHDLFQKKKRFSSRQTYIHDRISRQRRAIRSSASTTAALSRKSTARV